MQSIAIDVSQLEAPEPMRVILQALATLTADQELVVSHRKEPFPLYPKIIELGFTYHVTKPDELYLITISHRVNK